MASNAHFQALSKTISAMMQENTVSTVDKFVAFLKTKIEVDEELDAVFTDIKNNMLDEIKQETKDEIKAAKKAAKKDVPKEPKKKRAASAFNIFVKDKMAELKAAGETGNLMSKASAIWKENTDDETKKRYAELAAQANTASHSEPEPDASSTEVVEPEPEVEKEQPKPNKGGKKATKA
jgi:hypothetical protein